MRSIIILTGMATLLLACTGSADGVPIDPGQWEMTTTMTISIMPEPQTTTTKECIKEDVLDPETFNMDEDNPCSISDVKVDGNTLHCSINCPTEGGPVMEGQWQITSKGDSLTGKGTMATDFNGQKMGFDMAWEGKRIGACP